jgi:hypothetical protein
MKYKRYSLLPQQRCCLGDLAVNCGFSRRSVPHIRNLAPTYRTGCALHVKKIKSLTRAKALQNLKPNRVMYFLMFSLALDIYLAPLWILSFLMYVSLSLVFHKYVTSYTFTMINLHSSISFLFTTDNCLLFIYNYSFTCCMQVLKSVAYDLFCRNDVTLGNIACACQWS